MVAEGGATDELRTELEDQGVQDVVQMMTPVPPGATVTAELKGDRRSRLNLALVVASGAGSASRQAIGITIVAGFAIGTLFTLFVLPVFYTYFARDRRIEIGDDIEAPDPVTV